MSHSRFFVGNVDHPRHQSEVDVTFPVFYWERRSSEKSGCHIPGFLLGM